MPYIKKADREEQVVMQNNANGLRKYSVDTVVQQLIKHIKTQPNKKGLCNYIVTRIVAGGMEPVEGWGYDSISNARACLQDASDELLRRLMNGYEDSCIERNGDVPEYKEPNFKNRK